MKYFSICVFLLSAFTGCHNKNNNVKILNGYIVYILPNHVRFVETIQKPNSNYLNSFKNDNFKTAISFEPDCHIEQIISKLKVDTLIDENPDLKEYASFLKRTLIFPASISILDTSTIQNAGSSKFKMIFRGRKVEFEHFKYQGVVINVRRID